jgi:hypothetical protein
LYHISTPRETVYLKRQDCDREVRKTSAVISLRYMRILVMEIQQLDVLTYAGVLAVVFFQEGGR